MTERHVTVQVTMPAREAAMIARAYMAATKASQEAPSAPFTEFTDTAALESYERAHGMLDRMIARWRLEIGASARLAVEREGVGLS